MVYSRITIDPQQMAGEPCVRGLRIPIATLIEMVAQGMSIPQICSELPDVVPEDVVEALRFAAQTVREHEMPLVGK
jgi:uncharacterized protein (DUF433 family)